MARTENRKNPDVAAWLRHVRDRIDLQRIDADARRSIKLVIAGPRSAEVAALLSADATVASDPLVVTDALPSAADLPRRARAVIYAPDPDSGNGSPADIAEYPVPIFVLQVRSGEHAQTEAAHPHKPTAGHTASYSLTALNLVELRKYVLPDVAAAYGDLEIPLAAQVPAFRPVVAARLTLNCAMNSLKIAAASALADHIPMIGFITGGIASAGDTIAITALQMRMLLQIASAYGKKAEFARIIELLPVVGGGYGWRTLAREASGFIPVAGIVIKAGIAYAGTVVVGQAASYYYETGSHLPPHAVSSLYREATARAKALAKQLADRVRKRGG